MKNKIILLGLFLLIISVVSCNDSIIKTEQITTESDTTYMSTNEEIIYSIQFDSNGGTEIEDIEVILGDNIPVPEVERDGYILDGWYVKTTNSYSEKWSFFSYTVSQDMTLIARWIPEFPFEPNPLIYGEYLLSEFNDIIQDSNGEYIVVGMKKNNSIDDFNFDILVIKFSRKGEIIWEKIIGGSNSESATSIIQDNQGYYIIAGSTRSNDGDMPNDDNTSLDGFILKMNSCGEIIWLNKYASSGVGRLNSIKQDQEGNYVTVGYHESNIENEEASDGYILKVNQQGEVINSGLFGGSGIDKFNDFIINSMNEYIIVGRTTSTDGDISDGTNGVTSAFVVKLDNNLDIIWTKTFGEEESQSFNSIAENGNYYYLTGNIYLVVNTRFNRDGYIVKIDNEGNEIWNKTYGSSEYDGFNSIIIDDENNIIICGSTEGYEENINNLEEDINNGRLTDGLLMKIDLDGIVISYELIGGSEYDVYYALIQNSFGDYVAVGRTKSIDYDFEFYDSVLFRGFIKYFYD